MRLHRDEGAAAVEFALVSLLLFLLVFGIIEFGFAFYSVQGAAAAAREGARRAAVGAITSCDTTTVQNRTDLTWLVKDVAPGVQWPSTGSIATMATVDDHANGIVDPGDTVIVTIHYNVNLPVLSALVPGIHSLTGQTQKGEARIEYLASGSVTTCP